MENKRDFLKIINLYRCLLDQRNINIRGAPTKEIGRIILESFRVERDDYALGASKVFIRENLEAVLEKHRQDILEVEVLKLQRFVRGSYFWYFLMLFFVFIWFTISKDHISGATKQAHQIKLRILFLPIFFTNVM